MLMEEGAAPAFKRPLASILLSLLAWSAALSSGAALGQPSEMSPPTPPLTYTTLQIDMDVRPASLQFVQADDGDHRLAYNLFVTNWSNWPLRFARVDVEEADTGRV